MPQTSHRALRRGACAFAALSLTTALAACGSDSDAADADDGMGPIRIGAMAPVNTQDYPLPEIEGALESAVQEINETGGVHGRELELDFCDTRYDPNAEVACARDLVESEVSAVVYPYATLAVDSVYRIFEQAQVPVVGHIGVTPTDLTSEVAFPLSSGIIGWWYGAAAALVEHGATEVSIVSIPSTVAAYGRELALQAFEDAGLKVNQIAIGEINTADWSAIAANAMKNGTDGILVGNTPVDAPRTIAALREAGYSGAISTISSLMTPESIEALGEDAEGVHVVSLQALHSDTSNKAVSKYRAAMIEDSIKISEYSLQAWSAVQLYAAVMDDASAADSETTLATFENLSKPVDIGVTAPYAVKGSSTPVDYPRMFNPTVVVATIEDGILSTTGEYVNPFELTHVSAQG